MQDYVHGEGRLLGGIRENYFRGRRHFHVDHLGTTRLITDASRTMISAHDFYPFGIEQTDPEFERKAVNLPMQLDRRSRTEPLKYTSHEREFLGWYNWENTEYLDYMHARFYDPNKGRFLSVDPVITKAALRAPQLWNRYAYVGNNPINRIDPDGRLLQLTGCAQDANSDACKGQTKLLQDGVWQAMERSIEVPSVRQERNGEPQGD